MTQSEEIEILKLACQFTHDIEKVGEIFVKLMELVDQEFIIEQPEKE